MSHEIIIYLFCPCYRYVDLLLLSGNGVIEFIPEYVTNMVTRDMSQEAAVEMFELDDTDHNGRISRDELLGIARRLGVPEQEATDQIERYYMSLDSDNNGSLEFNG